MITGEYFTSVSGWENYPFRGEGPVRAHEHPVSERFIMPPGTKYILLENFIGDPATIPPENSDGLPFWERLQPARRARGPIISLEEYAAALAEVQDESSGRRIPPDMPMPDWVDHPKEGFLYQPSLHIATRVEVPSNPNNHQIKATTVYQREAPAGVPVYTGTSFVARLRDHGFAPDSFPEIAARSGIQQVGVGALEFVDPLLNLIDQRPLAPLFKGFAALSADAAVKRGVTHGQFHDITRTSRHRKAPGK
jgi:hypothetical protein